MKTTLIALSCFFYANAYSSELNLDYGSMIKELKSCRTSLEGCSAQEELEIAQFEGKVLDPYTLNNYLSQDSQKSYFIPLSLNDQELLTLAAATSLGVVAFHNDQEIMDTVQRNKSNVTATISSVGNFLGSSAVVPIAAGSYFLGVYYHDNKLKKVALFTVSASLAHSIVTTSVKTYFGRSRPKEDVGPYDFFNPGNKSFYSGHTAEAFTLATVISEMYKDEHPIVPYVAYGLATVGAYARLHDKAHWASDVIVGAVAGHLIAKLTMNAINGNPDGRSGLQVYPGYDAESGAYMIYAEWREKELEKPLKCSKMPEGNAKVEACLAEGFARAAKN